MGSVIGSCLATCGCACLDKACGGCRSKSGSLIPYMVLFIFFTIIALILRYWGSPLLIDLYIYHLDLCDTGRCLGVGGVNRISFALFVFFFIHGVFIKFVPSCSRLDAQSWWTKLFGFILLLVCAWLIPNDFYNVYMHISRIVSGFFLLLQLVILIDFAYEWNNSWTSEEKQWNKAVLAVSVLMYLASLTFFILDLFYFGRCDGENCSLEKFFIGFTFVLTFLMTGLSVSNWVGDGGGLLPAAVVTLYSYWMLFSALTSDPSDCNSVSSRSREFVPLIIGLVLTTASIAYASWSVATNTTLFSGSNDGASGGGDSDALTSVAVSDESANAKSDSSVKEPRRAAMEDDGEDEEADEPVDSVASQERAQLSARFHLLMAAASMYLCMLLSQWGSQSAAEDPDSAFGLDKANMWIKIVTQWACIGLYVWTLIAPVVCSGRDFS